MPDCTGQNLLRLMAGAGLSIHQVAQRTGLDERTIRGILNGTNKPHSRTIHRLAEGLGADLDEFFIDPTQLLYRNFDRQTNPLIDEVLQTHAERFSGWTEADFDELHSRVGTGGPLSREGVLTAARQMNRKRELHEKLDLLLESSQAELISGIMEMLHQHIVVEKA